MPSRILAAALAAPLALPAQGFVVSPTQYQNVAGPSSYAGCWYYTDHSQQVHGDLRTQPLSIKSLAFRRAAITTTDPSGVARTVDAELFCGEGDMATAGTAFAGNYQGTPANVVQRKSLSLPDWTLYAGSPAPFDFVVPFDQPFTYTASSDFVWEVVVWSNTVSGSYLADACSGVPTLPGQVGYTGLGCQVAGHALRMVLTASLESIGSSSLVSLQATCANAPLSANAALLLGVSDPALSDPIVCASLHSDGLVSINGMTDALGAIAFGPLQAPHTPQLVGQVLYSQVIAADPAQPGVPFALSNGAWTQVPDLPPPLPLVKLIRAQQMPSATHGQVYAYRGQIVRLGL